MKDCSQQGYCTAPDKCKCFPGYDGVYCDEIVRPNLHEPVFNFQFYRAFVNEDTPIGTFVLQVKANDSDTGRNGEVLHSLVDGKKPDATLLFAIERSSGNISTSTVLDYDTLQVHSYNLTVMASDNGLPQRLAFATVQITVQDINDNCPVFSEPSASPRYQVLSTVEPGTVITRVRASDLDSGENGLVSFNISSFDHASELFSIDPDNGTIVTSVPLSVRHHSIIVIASDHGTPPCSQEINITVDSVSATTSKPTSPKGKRSITIGTLRYPDFGVRVRVGRHVFLIFLYIFIFFYIFYFPFFIFFIFGND